MVYLPYIQIIQKGGPGMMTEAKNTVAFPSVIITNDDKPGNGFAGNGQSFYKWIL